MLTESEKTKLVNKIKKLVRESIAENGYFENFQFGLNFPDLAASGTLFYL